MVVDLLPVLNNEGAERSVEGLVELNHLKLSESGPEFLEPVSVKGSMVNIGGAITFTGTVSGSFRVLCARCAKELCEPFAFDFSEALSNDTEKVSDDDTVVAFSGTAIDITDIVISNILTNLSLRYLCSDDCKGLCPKCGADLNVSPCNCDSFEVDPRMSVLKNLLN